MRYIVLGMDWINEILFDRPYANNGINKPLGGLWASPYLADNESLSEWGIFSKENIYNKDKYCFGISFELKDDAKVYTINTFADLLKLYDKHEFDKDKKMYRRLLDFGSLATQYDAIHLTKRGEINTRFTNPTLYGWDVETLLILNYSCINTKTYISHGERSYAY